jgi:hypothetical protein
MSDYSFVCSILIFTFLEDIEKYTTKLNNKKFMFSALISSLLKVN